MPRRLYALLVFLVFRGAALFCQSIDMASVEAAELFRTGVRTFHRGIYQSAILSFERSLSLKPENRQVVDWLAAANYRAGYVEAAIRGWRDLTGTDYDNPAIRNRLQYATFRHGLGAELAAPPTWVLAYQILSRRGEADAFRRPVSVRTRRDGSLLVASLAGNQLVHMDVNGSVLATMRGGLAGFDKPFDAIEVPQGLVVSELGGRRIVRYTAEGQRTTELGRSAGAPRLMGPQFLARDSAGYLYVTDWGVNRVHKYDPDGAYVLSFNSPLQEPTGIAISGDDVYVAERGGRRLAVFDTSGNLSRYVGEGFLDAPEGLAFWDDQTILVADTKRLVAGAVDRDAWTEWGELGSVARRLTSVAVDMGGNLYLTDMDAEALYVLTRQQNLIAGNNVWIGRIASDDYPRITMEVSVTDRYGRPVTGLQRANFLPYEANASVASFDLVRRPPDPSELDVVVVVDRSPEMAAHGEELRTSVLSIYDELSGAARLGFVAGETPTVVAPAGLSRLRTAEAVMKGAPSARWRIDTALRVAADELGPRWGRKAVIYLTAGGIGRRAFEATSLAESAAALSNNDIGFTVASLAGAPVADELSYLVRETGGMLISLSSPRGARGLAAELAAAVRPVYLLSFLSGAFPDYGRRYLSVRVEVALPGTSGGDISGYFAPVER